MILALKTLTIFINIFEKIKIFDKRIIITYKSYFLFCKFLKKNINYYIKKIEQLYQFRDDLKKIFPQNHHIDDKIRQTLQFLRNDGLIEFLNFGSYQKNWLTLT